MLQICGNNFVYCFRVYECGTRTHTYTRKTSVKVQQFVMEELFMSSFLRILIYIEDFCTSKQMIIFFNPIFFCSNSAKTRKILNYRILYDTHESPQYAPAYFHQLLLCKFFHCFTSAIRLSIEQHKTGACNSNEIEMGKL